MSNTITILLGDVPEESQDRSTGFGAPGIKRNKLELDPRQIGDILMPIIEALEMASSAAKGSLRISEAEFCIGVDAKGNIGIRPLGGVEAGLKTALKVILKNEPQSHGEVPSESYPR